MVKAYITEVFQSIQGEGLFIGYPQIFIRLSGCIFDCPYCDTDFLPRKTFFINDKEVENPIDAKELAKIIVEEFNYKAIHSFSFTGGEPLINADFVEVCAVELKKLTNKPLFLETSGLVTDELERFDELFDIMSIDIKTHNAQVINNLDELFRRTSKILLTTIYYKLLYDDTLGVDYLNQVIDKLKRNKIKGIVLQPIDNALCEENMDKLIKKFHCSGVELRIIPQTHKVLQIR